ncbi:MAG: DUF3326 domain-containing protein [Planctomycetes bacterium]|nr:DUF3326 domain-containing protein [Planctomycetota bacterium]
MLLTEREIDIPISKGSGSLLSYFEQAISKHLDSGEIPVRFAVTESNATSYHCEIGLLAGLDNWPVNPCSIFDFDKREIENSDKFNTVFLVPTGIGAEIGGHAGDATPAARLLAGACDTLITHPNVVNASDINELPENGLYVEGSVLAQLLMGTVGLQKVRANRVMLVIDKHIDSRISDFSINAASAARTTLGLDCPKVIMMDPPIKMRAEYSGSGRAVGRIEYFERLCKVLHENRTEYDAIALATITEVSKEIQLEYFGSHGEMINPWGGVEAMLTHAVSMLFGVASAHAPMLESVEMLEAALGVVDPRMSAEAVSACFLHCVLKGLYKSPKIITDRMLFSHPGVLTAADVSCLVIPEGCVGLPSLAAMEQGIPVIAVRENHNCMKNDLAELPFEKGKFFIAENYLEAVGIMTALKEGVTLSSVRRPLADTVVTCQQDESQVEKEVESKG